MSESPTPEQPTSPYGYSAPGGSSSSSGSPSPYSQGYQQAPYTQPGGQQDYHQAPYVQPGYYQQNPQGYPQPGYPQGYGPYKSKVAAGLFGILLGGLGIHNFYLGFTSKAVTQLLISVLSFGMLAWVSGIWGLIEGILILAGSENYRTDANGLPLRD